MRQATQEGRPLALVIDHDLGGGANTYRSALLRELESEGFLPVLLIAHRGISAYRVEAAFGGRMQSAHAGGMDALFSALSAAPFQKVIFNNILSFPSPWEFVLRLAAWQRKHPPKTFRFLVHDHYSVCPSTFLLDCSNTYCGVPDTDVCATCLPANPAPFIRQAPGHTVESWRSAWAELLAQAHEIRCFSEYSRRILLKAYPDTDGAKLTVVPHSINPALRPVMCSGMNNPVVAVIGHINIYKGNEVVRKVAEHIRASGKAIRLVIVGTFEGKIDSEIVRVTGPYRVEQLPDIVETQGVNVVLFPSICPETFSFVTEEAIQMGLPIIAFDFGAQGERVATYAKGKVIPPLSSAEAIVGAIEELHRFKST